MEKKYNKKKIIMTILLAVAMFSFIFIYVNHDTFIKNDKKEKKKVIKPVIHATDFSVNVGSIDNFDDIITCTNNKKKIKCKITGDYDMNKIGIYKLTITATNKDKQKTTKVINMEVVENSKEEESITTDDNTTNEVASNLNPCYTEVIRNQNVVIVYGLDSNNNYTKVQKTFVSSVGKDGGTPTGTFTTTDKYEWRALFGGVYGQYATRIVNSILFHSVPYYSQSKDNLEWEEYNKLGDAASMGCVRMAVSDVKWLYDNCPSGMTVKIYDGDIPNGITKPNAIKIDGNDSRRGWDPTDPDSNNPWK